MDDANVGKALVYVGDVVQWRGLFGQTCEGLVTNIVYDKRRERKMCAIKRKDFESEILVSEKYCTSTGRKVNKDGTW